ncbi:early B-cell factor [Sarotherodon galilaeus]
MSLANKHIVTCIVRPVNPDSKRALPVAEYMKRFHVSKWKRGQGARTKTLTVVHALVPKGNLFAYCKKLQRTFLSWLPPNNNTLCPKLSLQDILDCELDRGSVYFINALEFTGPDPSDVDYAERSSTELTFGLQIQSYNKTMPVRRPNSTGHDFQDPFTWETTHTPHMDDSTRRELGLTPRCVPSATPTMPEQGPSAGSYPADEPSTLQVAIDASVNEPQPTPHSMSPVSSGRPTDLYTCPCCYELTHVCV